MANLDKQKEIAENKNTSKEFSETEKLMDKITFAMGGNSYYNSKQLKAIESVVKAWIAEMFVTQILTTDTEDNSIWAEFCKEAGLSDAGRKKFLTDIEKKAFKKLGLYISPIINSDIGLHWKNKETSTTIKVYHEDSKTYDIVTVNLNFGNLFSNSKPFKVLRTLDYTIETPDNKKPKPAGVGMVTFVGLQTFSENEWCGQCYY